jgi:hypothetical protein
LREGLFSGAEKDGVGMPGCLVGKRGDVKASETDERTFASVVVRDPVCAVSIGDVDLDDDQVGSIVRIELFYVFVDDDGVVVGR